MRRSSFALALLTLTLAASACTYKSVYIHRSNNHPGPVSAGTVKIAKSADDIVSEYEHIGDYTGKAPTVKEAMATAQKRCAMAGADLYILYMEPFPSSGGFEVRGMCARSEHAK